MSRRSLEVVKPTQVRCAIYTRKSTEEGLEQEYNTLDAQRDSGEAYIKSQQHEGWVCIVDHYDDGGFTGANMDRPALRRLLADIENGKVDCVVVYKVDRLSRSLLDFGRIMESFDKHKVSFVSVTQAFNTASSMGRLMLNVLLSFAQFEREMISERTRDKIAAARRKGKWSGGMPVLGYTVVDTKLVVDKDEAAIVRQIFDLYLEHRSLLTVVTELGRRGWRTKRWTTRKGITRGGKPFDKGSLYQLLTNVVCVGQVRYKSEVHPGEHAGTVTPEVFTKVQSLLKHNGRSGGSDVRNRYGALLRGLLHCASCDCGMSHSFTAKGTRRYRYYVCHHAQKRGWATCPAPSIPAGEVERFVVDEIRGIGRDPSLIAETVAAATQLTESQARELEAERRSLFRAVREDSTQLERLASLASPNATLLADLHRRIRAAEERVEAVDSEVARLRLGQPTEADVTMALSQFDSLWDSLSPREQGRVLELLIERVSYDGRAGSISITFRPSGLATLADGAVRAEEEVAC